MLSTNVMTFLSKANLFGFSVLSLLSFLGNIVPVTSSSSNNMSLDSSWYLSVGYQIWLNMLILCFVPQVIMPPILLIK